MKTAYRLHCANINEMEDIYIGVIEFQTYDMNEMVEYIDDMDDEDIDELYTVEEYEADDNNFVKTGSNMYYLPTMFAEGRKKV